MTYKQIFGAAFSSLTPIFDILNRRYDGKVLILTETMVKDYINFKKYKIILINGINVINAIRAKKKKFRATLVIFDFYKYLELYGAEILDTKKGKPSGFDYSRLIDYVDNTDIKLTNIHLFENNLLENHITNRDDQDFFKHINNIIYANFISKNREIFRHCVSKYMIENKTKDWFIQQATMLAKTSKTHQFDELLAIIDSPKGKQLSTALKYYKNHELPKILPKKFGNVSIFDIANLLHYYKFKR